MKVAQEKENNEGDDNDKPEDTSDQFGGKQYRKLCQRKIDY